MTALWTLTACRSERRADVLDEHLDVVLVRRRRLEAVAEVEVACVVVERVDKHGSDAEFRRGGQGPEHRVAQEPGTETMALGRAVHREPGQEHDGDRMSWHPLGHARCGFTVLDR